MVTKQAENGSNGNEVVATGSHGKLSLTAASVFIVGEMAGSGVLALPAAVAATGWTGAALIVICCLASGMAAVYLGKCWNIIEERYPEYQGNTGSPYSIIGLKAVGPKMSVFVTLNVVIQLFGVAVVFLILSSNLLNAILASYDWGVASQIGSCNWIVILGILACPLMWLPSPQEITVVAYSAMSATAISCVLIIIMYAQQTWTNLPTSGPLNVEKFFISLGTISFAYGGAATFPTFQNFMKDRKQFPYAVGIGFVLMLVLYIPVAVGGYLLYADKVEANVLDSLPDGGLKTAVNLLMALHVFAALLIVINPVNMSFEQFLDMPCGKLSYSKCLLRTIVCFAIILVGLSLPKFGKILSLVGATTVATTSFIFPPLFYLALIRKREPDFPVRHASVGTQILCYSIAALGTFVCIVSTYSSVKDIIYPSEADEFSKPCYA